MLHSTCLVKIGLELIAYSTLTIVIFTQADPLLECMNTESAANQVEVVQDLLPTKENRSTWYHSDKGSKWAKLTMGRWSFHGFVHQ